MMIAGQFIFLSSSFLNPPMARELGVGLSAVMVFNSLMAVSGVFAMSLLAPALFRRIGVRGSIITGGLWMAAVMAAVSLVHNLVLLYALGFAAGLSFGIATSMAASMLVNTWFEARRGTVMGAVFAVSGLGGISAGIALPALVSGAGWRPGFLVLAGLLVVLVVLPGIFLVRSQPSDVGLRPFCAPDEPEASGTEEVHLPGVPARQAFRTPQFAALALSLVLVATVLAVQQHFAPLMVEHGVPLPLAGSLISLMALASVFANILLGMLNDRRGTLGVVLLALASLALAMVAYVFSSGFAPLAASTVLFAVGAAFPGVLIPIVVMQVFGLRDYPVILGPTMAMMPAGISIGTPLWGIALDATGSYTTALWGAAALTTVSAALLAWTIRSSHRLRRAHQA